MSNTLARVQHESKRVGHVFGTGTLCLSLVFSLSFFVLSSPELSDTKVDEPQKRALLGTAAHFYKVVVLKLRIVPIGTALSGLGVPDTGHVDRCRPKNIDHM